MYQIGLDNLKSLARYPITLGMYSLHISQDILFVLGWTSIRPGGYFRVTVIITERLSFYLFGIIRVFLSFLTGIVNFTTWSKPCEVQKFLHICKGFK